MNTTDSQTPIVTVAVCTYNRAHILVKCIECLLRQEVAFEVYTILVVDNGSTDNTQSAVQQLISTHKNITYCHEARPGLSNARNRALKESATPFVAFIDDDGFAPPHWVSCMVEVINSKHPLIIGGPVRPYHDRTVPSWHPNDIEYISTHIPDGWVNAPSIFGGNFAVHTSSALSYGGFDPKLGMVHGEQKYHEETALAYAFLKKGHRIYFSHTMWIEHLVMANRYSYFFYGHNNYLKGSDAQEMQDGQYALKEHGKSQHLKNKLQYQLHHIFFAKSSTPSRNKQGATHPSIVKQSITEQQNMADQMWILGNTLGEIKRQLLK